MTELKYKQHLYKITDFNQTTPKEDQECHFNSIGVVDLR